MEAIIKQCNNCNTSTGPAALAQNNMYGFGNRVHTPSQGGKAVTPKLPKCTVCGRAS